MHNICLNLHISKFICVGKGGSDFVPKLIRYDMSFVCFHRSACSANLKLV